MRAPDLNSLLKRNPRKLELRRLYIHFVVDVLLWVAIASLSLDIASVFAHALAAILFAFFSFRSFSLMHECVHSAGHSNRKMNNILGAVYGVFCFLPYARWRQLHLEHHIWTGNVDKDPSMKILIGFEAMGFKMPNHVDISWRKWIPFLGLMQHVVFWRQTLSAKQYPFLIASAIYLSASALLLGPLTLLVALAIYLEMVEIINFPHHLGMPQHKGEIRFATYEQSAFTRSCIYPKWFAHYVLLNFNLHNEHHLLPSHPWYQLDAIHEELKALGLELNSCAANAWIIENRMKPIDEVLMETFATERKKAA